MAKTNTGRRPIVSLESVQYGALLASSEKAKATKDKMRPDVGGSLAIARVVSLDYEEFFVTLKTISGTPGQFIRTPVPLTFPGAGARHFFAALPMIGDYCVIGWMNQESSRKEDRSPVVLAWMIPGVFPGRDWVTTSEFEKDEHDIESPKDKSKYEGVFDVIRHKLRHIQPGNIVASSAQGSDLVLDEGVTLANRRGNEFRLRDQDQAAVTRALQRFDALAGVRSYHGMVQRDALLLAPYMVSDGKVWDSKTQLYGNDPVTEDELLDDPTAPSGFLTPAGIFRKTPQEIKSGQPAPTPSRPRIVVDQNMDPYTFLKQGGFLDSSGFVVDTKYQPTALYGGKPVFRVSSQTSGNAALDPGARTLTEYRIEVTHTADGRLPVTEQTDMFDAERLPDNDPAGIQKAPSNSPYIEWVLGSVIGNDPYSIQGRQKYGVPVKAVIFDGSSPAPRLDPIPLPSDPNNKEKSVNLDEHAATLFRLSPLDGTKDTFYTFNKKGQLKANIGGPIAENSLEAFFQGGIKLGVAGNFDILTNNGLHMKALGTSSANIIAEKGAVTIYGGGAVVDASAVGERNLGTGRGESDLPSVRIEARTNAEIKAGQRVKITGQEVSLEAPSVHIRGTQEATLDAVDRIGMSTQEMNITVNGKMSEAYSGPKNLLPTNGALHERTYAHLYMLNCEDVLYALGSRQETFVLGNHTTTMLVGNMTYSTAVGKWTAIASTASLTMGPEGVTGTALSGNMALTATAGAASLTGLAAVSVVSLAGPAVVKGATSVYLGAPITGTDFGGILASGSREPFTNLPFITWGIGSKTHLIGI